MATRKKSIPEQEISRQQDAAPAKPAAPRVKKTASAAKPKSAPKASAATHKAPARKPVQTASVVAPSFDVELYRAEIEVEAYHHWLRRGAPHGSAEHDWLSAIEIVRARVIG